MSKKSIAITVISMLLIVVMVLITWKFKVHYYLTSTAIIILSMIPMFSRFENMEKDARHLVIIAVMSAIAVASRVVFMPLPSIKPVIAIIMIAGFAFGPSSGFLCGSITAFVSNFFFSQGSWTPWQMFAWGVGGLIAGLLARFKYTNGTNRIISAILGFLVTFLIVGPILDTSSVLTMLAHPTIKKAIPIYIAGVPVNLTLAISTAVTLLILAGPMLKKLDRIKLKYDI